MCLIMIDLVTRLYDFVIIIIFDVKIPHPY